MMSKVGLVFPYFRTRAATELLFAPLGVATLAGQLRRLGIETRIFDCTFGTFEQLHADLTAYGPDIVGISSMVSLTRNTMRIAEMVRQALPHSLLAAGGPMPSVFPRRFARHFDVVFRGEADLSFPRFCRDYFEQSGPAQTMAELPLEAYCGLFVPNHGLTVDNPATHHSEDELEAFPLPDRSDFDHAAYQEVWFQETGTKIASIIVTLGCPFACDFCSKPIFGNVVRRRSLDAVFAEIAEVRTLGYDGLWIADDTFTLDGPYLEEFCRRMAGQAMTWTCLARAEGISEDSVRLMKVAGCRRVYLGLESGSQATLKLMHKQVTVEDGVRTVHLYRKAGIETAGFFIVGYPGETAASIEETFKLALTLPLDEISFNVPFPLPGSALFARLGGPDDGVDWNEENEVTFVYHSEFDADWLRRRISETIQAFAEKPAAAAER
jgi:anaerobic magnesium-protoporphyrin IX monomethyl ester cyclase